MLGVSGSVAKECNLRGVCVCVDVAWIGARTGTIIFVSFCLSIQ